MTGVAESEFEKDHLGHNVEHGQDNGVQSGDTIAPGAEEGGVSEA